MSQPRDPITFGRLVPERQKMLERLMDELIPHIGDLMVGESEGFRLAMTKDGQRERLKVIFEGKRKEVLL